MLAYKKFYSFVSICSDCVKQKQKNTQIFVPQTNVIKHIKKVFMQENKSDILV